MTIVSLNCALIFKSYKAQINISPTKSHKLGWSTVKQWKIWKLWGFAKKYRITVFKSIQVPLTKERNWTGSKGRREDDDGAGEEEAEKRGIYYPRLQRRTPGNRDVRQSAQSHTARKRRSWFQNACSSQRHQMMLAAFQHVYHHTCRILWQLFV